MEFHQCIPFKFNGKIEKINIKHSATVEVIVYTKLTQEQ